MSSRSQLPLSTQSPAFALILTAAILLGALPVRAQAASEVCVLATLYHRHSTTPAYSHDSLRQIIQRIDPDVVILDVSPKELRSRTVAPSKENIRKSSFPSSPLRAIRPTPASRMSRRSPRSSTA